MRSHLSGNRRTWDQPRPPWWKFKGTAFLTSFNRSFFSIYNIFKPLWLVPQRHRPQMWMCNKKGDGCKAATRSIDRSPYYFLKKFLDHGLIRHSLATESFQRLAAFASTTFKNAYCKFKTWQNTSKCSAKGNVHFLNIHYKFETIEWIDW
jgi:hypothetical protein